MTKKVEICKRTHHICKVMRHYDPHVILPSLTCNHLIKLIVKLVTHYKSGLDV